MIGDLGSDEREESPWGTETGAVDRGRYEKGEGPMEHTEGKPQGSRMRPAEARTEPLAGARGYG